MPTQLSYPGVYVEEVPSGVRTIVGVATSVTAFVGRAKRGEVSAPITINSFADFEREFGGLWGKSFLGFAVKDYFLNGGSKAVIVRLYHPIYENDQERNNARAAAQTVADAAVAAAAATNAMPETVKNAARTAADAITTPPESKNAADLVATAAEAVAASNADAANAVAASARKAADDIGISNILEKLISGLVAKAAEDAAGAPNASSFSVTTAVNAAKQKISDAAAAIAKAASDELANNAAADAASVEAAVGSEAANFAADPEKTVAQHMQTIANAAAQAAGATATSVSDAVQNTMADITNVVNADTVEPAALSTAAGLVNAVSKAASEAINTAAPLGRARLDYSTLELEAASEGEWGNTLKIRVDHDTKDSTNPNLFNLSILAGGTGQVERHRNLSVATGDVRYVGSVLTNESTLMRLRAVTARPAEHQDPPDNVDSPFDDGAGQAHSKVTELSSDGSDLHRDDFIGTGTAANKKGLYALENADLFNLLCIPPYSASNGEAVDVDPQLWAAAAVFCEKRRAMLIVDPQNAWTSKKNAKDGLNTIGTSSKNAAVFFPKLLQSNPLRNDQMEAFVPCGAVAGVMARTDASRGVWKAPAGLEATLNGVPELTVSLTDAENGELNPLGLNCLRNMVPSGRVVWGARTLEGADSRTSEWKYIPVRRTALFLEETLYRNLRWVVFEPNDEPLWAQIRLNVGAFMQNLFRQGAFQGRSSREAYLVKCDRETTTQNDINLGVVNILVGFAPLKPAEFVVIKIQQLAGQIQA